MWRFDNLPAGTVSPVCFFYGDVVPLFHSPLSHTSLSPTSTHPSLVVFSFCLFSRFLFWLLSLANVKNFSPVENVEEIGEKQNDKMYLKNMENGVRGECGCKHSIASLFSTYKHRKLLCCWSSTADFLKHVVSFSFLNSCIFPP